MTKFMYSVKGQMKHFTSKLNNSVIVSVYVIHICSMKMGTTLYNNFEELLIILKNK